MYGPGNWKDVWRHVGTKSEVNQQLALRTLQFCQKTLKGGMIV